jgi:predicted HicB family RNase H-like nuclease
MSTSAKPVSFVRAKLRRMLEASVDDQVKAHRQPVRGKQVKIRIDDDLHASLVQEARERGVTLNRAIGDRLLKSFTGNLLAEIREIVREEIGR